MMLGERGGWLPPPLVGFFGEDGAQEPGIRWSDIEDEDFLVILLRDGLRPLDYPALR